MTRKLIIFGNGIGMALDADKFALKRVMPEIWKDELDDDQRELIASCLRGVNAETGPTDEADLLRAQLAQLGHELISRSVESDSIEKWFQNKAVGYPQAISRYVYKVASKLNENSEYFQNDEVFSDFLDGLIPFVSKSSSHVATLNYDTLFYSAFNEERTIKSKSYQLCKWRVSTTDLNDGFRGKAGCEEEHFERPDDNDFGFYLHLHGSPLFVETEDGTRKLKRSQLEDHEPETARNIVLSSGSLKPHLIQRSVVLKLYWRMLRKALEEVEEIILFGYSGADKHLNALVRDVSAKKKFVVEWSEAEHLSEPTEVLDATSISAQEFWEGKIGGNTTVIQAANILAFREWDDPASFAAT